MATPGDSVSTAGPTIDSVHRDIAFANAYRMELIKHVMTISAALFAFTVTFRPALGQVFQPWAMWTGWAGLALSMVGGMVNMLGWDHYYKSYRDYDHGYVRRFGAEVASKAGKRRRNAINRWRRTGMACQYLGFAVGVCATGYFAAVNIDQPKAAPAACVPCPPPAVAQRHPGGEGA